MLLFTAQQFTSINQPQIRLPNQTEIDDQITVSNQYTKKPMPTVHSRDIPSEKVAWIFIGTQSAMKDPRTRLQSTVHELSLICIL